MKNFVQRGDMITVPAPVDAKSGDVLVIGELHGVVAGDAATGEPLDLATVGVFTLPKVGADAFVIGDAVYFATATKLATSVATGDRIGTAVAVAGAGSASVETKLV